jgi:hypothetical protein
VGGAGVAEGLAQRLVVRGEETPGEKRKQGRQVVGQGLLGGVGVGARWA